MRFVALILLILFFPIMLLIYLLLFFSSFSNPIFTQERVGLHKNLFTIYKFKTMEQGKITIIGRVLRKLGLDELPQLFNIIKGEMNFVGPRPLTQFDINRLEWNTATFDKRWDVKPGITGLAQLGSVCSKEASIKNDFYYIDNQSFLLDFKIISRTFFVPFLGKLTK